MKVRRRISVLCHPFKHKAKAIVKWLTTGMEEGAVSDIAPPGPLNRLSRRLNESSELTR